MPRADRPNDDAEVGKAGVSLEPVPRLLLTSSQAAAALAISERALWALAASGELPATHIGRSKRFAIAVLQEFAARNTRGESLRVTG